jgi:hypothetical protein
MSFSIQVHSPLPPRTITLFVSLAYSHCNKSSFVFQFLVVSFIRTLLWGGLVLEQSSISHHKFLLPCGTRERNPPMFEGIVEKTLVQDDNDHDPSIIIIFPKISGLNVANGQPHLLQQSPPSTTSTKSSFAGPTTIRKAHRGCDNLVRWSILFSATSLTRALVNEAGPIHLKGLVMVDLSIPMT